MIERSKYRQHCQINSIKQMCQQNWRKIKTNFLGKTCGELFFKKKKKREFVCVCYCKAFLYNILHLKIFSQLSNRCGAHMTLSDSSSLNTLYN